MSKSRSGLTPEETHAARVAGASVRTTPETRQRMVELWVERKTFQQIAALVGHDIGTVSYWIKKSIAASLEESRENNRVAIERILLGLERQARDAHNGYLQAVEEGDAAAAARFLTVERQADEARLKYGPVRDDEANQARQTSAADVAGIMDGLATAFAEEGLTPEQQQAVALNLIAKLGD